MKRSSEFDEEIDYELLDHLRSESRASQYGHLGAVRTLLVRRSLLRAQSPIDLRDSSNSQAQADAINSLTSEEVDADKAWKEQCSDFLESETKRLLAEEKNSADQAPQKKNKVRGLLEWIQEISRKVKKRPRSESFKSDSDMSVQVLTFLGRKLTRAELEKAKKTNVGTSDIQCIDKKVRDILNNFSPTERTILISGILELYPHAKKFAIKELSQEEDHHIQGRTLLIDAGKWAFTCKVNDSSELITLTRLTPRQSLNRLREGEDFDLHVESVSALEEREKTEAKAFKSEFNRVSTRLGVLSVTNKLMVFDAKRIELQRQNTPLDLLWKEFAEEVEAFKSAYGKIVSYPPISEDERSQFNEAYKLYARTNLSVSMFFEDYKKFESVRTALKGSESILPQVSFADVYVKCESIGISPEKAANLLLEFATAYEVWIKSSAAEHVAIHKTPDLVKAYFDSQKRLKAGKPILSKDFLDDVSEFATQYRDASKKFIDPWPPREDSVAAKNYIGRFKSYINGAEPLDEIIDRVRLTPSLISMYKVVAVEIEIPEQVKDHAKIDAEIAELQYEQRGINMETEFDNYRSPHQLLRMAIENFKTEKIAETEHEKKRALHKQKMLGRS